MAQALQKFADPIPRPLDVSNAQVPPLGSSQQSALRDSEERARQLATIVEFER